MIQEGWRFYERRLKFSMTRKTGKTEVFHDGRFFHFFHDYSRKVVVFSWLGRLKFFHDEEDWSFFFSWRVRFKFVHDEEGWSFFMTKKVEVFSWRGRLKLFSWQGRLFIAGITEVFLWRGMIKFLSRSVNLFCLMKYFHLFSELLFPVIKLVLLYD